MVAMPSAARRGVSVFPGHLPDAATPSCGVCQLGVYSERSVETGSRNVEIPFKKHTLGVSSVLLIVPIFFLTFLWNSTF